MKSWLKRFALSMFSDKHAIENAEYGAGNILLTCALAAIFLFVGIFVGRYTLFAVDYANADAFRKSAYTAFIDNGVSVSVNGAGVAQVTVNGEFETVNTFVDPTDKQKYGADGYEVIVDPHNVAETFDDFNAYCKNKNNGETIDYETYRALAADDKKEYKLVVEYSGRAKEPKESDAVGYIEYLKTVDAAQKELGALEDKKGTASSKEYLNELYSLYIKYYYPDMERVTGEVAPTLRNYYYAFAAKSDGKYLCVFGDMFTASFVSNVGKKAALGFGYDKGLAVGPEKSRAQNKAAVDEFIKDGYYGGIGALVFADYMSNILVILLSELVIVSVILLCWLFCRRCDIRSMSAFADSAKVVCSYAHVSALFATVVAALSGFLVGGFLVAVVGALVFFGIIAARTAVLLAREYKKAKLSAESDDADDIKTLSAN